MPVAMMDVGIVRMSVGQLIVAMDMGMWFAGRVSRLVEMLMVPVVRVKMLMRHRLVAVKVSVVLGEMEPYASGHEAPDSPEKQRWLLV